MRECGKLPLKRGYNFQARIQHAHVDGVLIAVESHDVAERAFRGECRGFLQITRFDFCVQLDNFAVALSERLSVGQNFYDVIPMNSFSGGQMVGCGRYSGGQRAFWLSAECAPNVAGASEIEVV